MNNKVAIFDMDGTLLESLYYWYNAPRAVLESMGVLPDGNEADALEKVSFSSIGKYAVEQFSLPCTPEDFSRAIDDWVLQRYADAVLPRPDVPQYLKSLCERNVKCVLLTASKKPFIDKMCQRFDFGKYFSACYSAHDLGIEKSNPEIYNVIFKDFNCAPEDCILFEDSAYSVEAARAAGVQSVGILDPLYPKNYARLCATCNRTIFKYRELLEHDVF